MKMKKKLFIPLIAALLTIGLTSVGFAAWVITGEKTADAGGDFTVYTVDEQYVEMTATASEKPVFGHPSTMTNQNAWLKFDTSATGDETEDLTVTLTIRITNWATLTNKNFTIEVDEFGVDLSGVTTPSGVTAVTEDNLAQYITLPSAFTITVENGAITSGNATIAGDTITTNLTFDWGSLVDNDNPYNFFNASGKTLDSHGTAAKNYLDSMETLKDAKYSVTVTSKLTLD